MTSRIQIALIAGLAGLGVTPGLTAESPTPDFRQVPGVVIDHSPASSRVYIGSPSLAVWTNGDYLASHDFFGPGSQNRRTAVFRSGDRGATWRRLTELDGQWWSTLFVHRGALYLIGTSRENGFAVIRRSTNGGQTWTTPRDKDSGLLRDDGRYHCAPVPVVAHGGRLWRAMEDTMGPGGWGSYFHAFMMSVPEDADLLQAANWRCSNRLGRDPQWLAGDFAGWLEGNAVVTPNGQIVDLLRVDTSRYPEKAALVQISDDGRTASFEPQTGFVDFPGGAKKFTVRFDPRSDLYWSLATVVPPPQQNQARPGSVRNTLALTSSPDLRHWTVRCVLLHHPDAARHGFQYVDWLFDGDDLIAACRTAYDDGLGGAHNYHDANFLTFHRFKNFRQFTMKDSALPFGGRN